MKKRGKHHRIFLVDRVKSRQVLHLGEGCSDNVIIREIMNKYPEYVEEPLLEVDLNKNMAVCVFSAVQQQGRSVQSFFRGVLSEDAKLFSYNLNGVSTITFVTTPFNLYAVTTGFAHQCISDVLHVGFGLNYISNFADNLSLSEVVQRKLLGAVYQSRNYFSRELSPAQVDSMDSISKAVGVRINDDRFLRNHLGLSEKNKKKSVKVQANDGLKISKSLTMDELLHLIQCCDSLVLDGSKNLFADITAISPNREKLLYETVMGHMAQLLLEKENVSDSIMLINPDIDAFEQATSYKILVGRKNIWEGEDRTDIINQLRKDYHRKKEKGEQITPLSYMMNVSICSVAMDEYTKTQGSLIKHIVGEIECNGKTYYFVTGEIYNISDNYTQKLRAELEKRLGKIIPVSRRFNTQWETGEDLYNVSLARETNGIELHKLTPDNIEFADVLFEENGEIALVHVKDGFDGSMRVLSHQISMSIQCLNDIKHNTAYVEKLYNMACKKQEIQKTYPRLEDFINALKRSRVKYIAAIHVRADFCGVESILNSGSNIAKHCLYQIIQDCSANQLGLEVVLI